MQGAESVLIVLVPRRVQTSVPGRAEDLRLGFELISPISSRKIVLYQPVQIAFVVFDRTGKRAFFVSKSSLSSNSSGKAATVNP